MKRLIETYLEDWKNNSNRKPLILRGARQVGKTYTIEHFAQNNFENYLYVNLEQSHMLHDVFRTQVPQNIINELSALYNVPIINGKTIIFIDEIQVLPEAIASLRYFYEQRPELHNIAAGYLLDHTLNDMPYPMTIGRVEFAYMFSLSFHEFLLAVTQEGVGNYLNSFNLSMKFSDAIHSKLKELLRLYFFIGGMPEAVKTYVDSGDLIEVEKVHSNILTSLQYDFAKYGTKKQQELFILSLNYVANNVGRKVKYSNIERNVHSSQVKEALLKLERSRIVHLVKRTRSVNPPITQFVDQDQFKTIFFDIGLACHLSQIKLNNIQNLVTDFEGALAEQFVGQEMVASFSFFRDMKLYYWARDQKNSNAEIDYLYQLGNEIIPVEVKAGRSGTLKSLQVYLCEKEKNNGIRLNLDTPSIGFDLNAGVKIENENKMINYNLLSLPLYYAGNLDLFENSFER